MTNFGLDVRPFTLDNFIEALRSPNQTRAHADTHGGARYLFGYLTELGARTLVVEHDYTDGDYLDDYANYYVKSFTDYGRRCKRIHVFDIEFDADVLRQQLVAAAPDTVLQGAYIGFIVARPLPMAIIGRTVLRTYPTDGGRRNYPSTRGYVAHLYGMPLTIESLAFQEQDTVLAACATVALWSAFQKTAVLFGTATPTPARITRAASAGLYMARALPSRGLNMSQMARAVSELGLEPEVFECSPTLPLLSLLHGYLALGIAPVLVFMVEGVGYHAVTVTGYSLRPAPVHMLEDTAAATVGIRRIGLRIDELYVHDDAHGPFAKIVAHTRQTPANEESTVWFDGTWSDPATKRPLKLEPKSVLVPVYNKVRLTFVNVQEWVTIFNEVASLTVSSQAMASAEWQIVLRTTNGIKQDIKSSALDPADMEHMLVRQQPRFLWCAKLSFNGQPYAELLFDATDMQRSVPLHDVLFYDATFRAEVARTLSQISLADVENKQAAYFLELLAEATK